MHKTQVEREKQDERQGVIARLAPGAIQAVLLERAKQSGLGDGRSALGTRRGDPLWAAV